MGQISVQDGGSPSTENLELLAEQFIMGDANMLGAVTAYDFMKPENRGKQIYICNGSACLCAGTQPYVEAEISKIFDADQIGHMTCLGRCHENSSFHFAGRNYSGNSIDSLTAIVQKERDVKSGSYSVSGNAEVLTAPFNTAEDFRQMLTLLLNAEPDEILAEVKDSGIRGRGGAGFPMAVKWESCRNEKSDQKFIICNADEGDPGAFSDRYLLEERPLSVIFGMLAAAYCTGAKDGVLFIRAEYPEAITAVRNAIILLRDNKLIGDNILNSGFSFYPKVIQAQGAYICGEETALINAIEGQRPEVRTRPPFPAQEGLFLKPTVVNNVETFASVFWILRNSGAEYAKLGTERSTGTKLVSLDGNFNIPGIVEVEMGTPLLEVIEVFGGGFKVHVKALHIGGPLGGIVPISKIEGLTVDFESFTSEGFLLGHASIICIPENFPMIKYLEHLFDFASFESCGKCFPCRLGTKKAYEMLMDAAANRKQINRLLFEDLLTTLQQGSLCAHGGGIPLPARNALQYFPEELERYFN